MGSIRTREEFLSKITNEELGRIYIEEKERISGPNCRMYYKRAQSKIELSHAHISGHYEKHGSLDKLEVSGIGKAVKRDLALYLSQLSKEALEKLAA